MQEEPTKVQCVQPSYKALCRATRTGSSSQKQIHTDVTEVILMSEDHIVYFVYCLAQYHGTSLILAQTGS